MVQKPRVQHVFAVGDVARAVRRLGEHRRRAGVEKSIHGGLNARLDDGRDLMVYVVHWPDGTKYPFASLVTEDGTRQDVDVTGLAVEDIAFWTSPATGVEYPVEWVVTLPAEQARIEVNASWPGVSRKVISLPSRSIW